MARDKLTDWHPRFGIDHALKEDNETQRQLAERLGWTESKLSKIIAGDQRLNVDDLTEVARAQERSIAWYFFPPFNRAKGVWRGPLKALVSA